MENVKDLKKIQVKGEKHLLPVEDAEIEKLLKRGLSIKSKMDTLKKDLETVQSRIVEIARDRREDTTTVTLLSISSKALITFRESYHVNMDVEDIKVPLGPLFQKFFDKKEDYKVTSDFKKFMESGHALGIDDPEKVKKEIMEYITIKETKPNVKIEIKE